MRTCGFVCGIVGLLLGNSVSADVPVADFARHTQYVDAAISPDGEYLAAVAVVKGKRVLALVHLADKKGVNLNPREGDELSGFRWVGSDRLGQEKTPRFWRGVSRGRGKPAFTGMLLNG